MVVSIIYFESTKGKYNINNIYMRGLLLNCTVVLILILGILIVVGGNKEGFLSSGSYPASVDNPMMVNSAYPYRTPGGLSDGNYSDQWKLYPVWAVGSYEQKTNNIKYWPQPCNGTAAPADICGGLYEKITPKDPCTPPPQRNCMRVNYYCY
jgi:hypothetical protein